MTSIRALHGAADAARDAYDASHADPSSTRQERRASALALDAAQEAREAVPEQYELVEAVMEYLAYRTQDGYDRLIAAALACHATDGAREDDR